MFSSDQLLAVQSSDFGPLAPIVSYATYAVSAAAALYVLVRGRSRKWEPSDTEVPRLAERTAIAIGAGATVLVFTLMNSREFIKSLVICLVVAAILLFIAFARFVGLSNRYLQDAPDKIDKNGQPVNKRIIAHEAHLSEFGKEQRRVYEEREKKKISLHDMIFGSTEYVPDIFDHDWRSTIRTKYEIAYFFLVLCFIVTIACTGQLLSIAAAKAAPGPTTAPTTSVGQTGN
jgi:hypothetical protein